MTDGKVPALGEHAAQVVEAQAAILRAFTPILLEMTEEERQGLIGKSWLKSDLRAELTKDVYLRHELNWVNYRCPLKSPDPVLTHDCLRGDHWGERDNRMFAELLPDVQPGRPFSSALLFIVNRPHSTVGCAFHLLGRPRKLNDEGLAQLICDKELDLTLAQVDALVKAKQENWPIKMRMDGAPNHIFVRGRHEGSIYILRVRYNRRLWWPELLPFKSSELRPGFDDANAETGSCVIVRNVEGRDY